MSARKYSDEEAREILGRAFATDAAQSGRLHHEDLVEAAREMGLDSSAVDRAASEVTGEREARKNVEARRRIKKQKFYRGLITFFIVNAFLFALNMLVGGGIWFPYVLLIWGAFVALRASKVLVPPSEEEQQRELQKEHHRLQAHYAREAEKRAREARRLNRRSAEQILEDNIERGVDRLLDLAARGIENLAPAPPSGKKRKRQEGGFADYIAGRRGTRRERSQSAASPNPSTPKTRVGQPEPAVPEPEEVPVKRRPGRTRKR